ncbi:MAG: NAD-dependent epimerase/dehydratase family protein [Bacteroidota bacterium]
MEKKILVTGVAGFVGMHTAKALVAAGHNVIGLDNLSDYYDLRLKYDRLKELGIKQNPLPENKLCDGIPNFKFIRLDLGANDLLDQLFSENSFDIVINLAAQAGVRYSIENPKVYVDSNIYGFFNILELCRKYSIKNLIYASSSSIYGNSDQIPFNETQKTDSPVSLYAATKKSNELMAHTYSHLFGITCVALRFFTVYGPWGRPDMAPFLFVKAAYEDQPIKVFNYGNQSRDFTYVADIVSGIGIVANAIEKLSGNHIYNIGCGNPVALMDFIKVIGHNVGKKIELNLLPAQDGDVTQTYASTEKLSELGYQPKYSLQEGIKEFVDWYKEYYHITD